MLLISCYYVLRLSGLSSDSTWYRPPYFINLRCYGKFRLYVLSILDFSEHVLVGVHSFTQSNPVVFYLFF